MDSFLNNKKRKWWSWAVTFFSRGRFWGTSAVSCQPREGGDLVPWPGQALGCDVGPGRRLSAAGGLLKSMWDGLPSPSPTCRLDVGRETHVLWAPDSSPDHGARAVHMGFVTQPRAAVGGTHFAVLGAAFLDVTELHYPFSSPKYSKNQAKVKAAHPWEYSWLFR